MSTEIIQYFLKLRNTLKVYHWLTLSYPRHKASDALIAEIDTLSDKFVEVYIGRYGRDVQRSSKASSKNMSIPLPFLKEDEVEDYLIEARDWLTQKLPNMLKKNDTELFNIRDELISSINQSLYLFKLS